VQRPSRRSRLRLSTLSKLPTHRATITTFDCIFYWTYVSVLYRFRDITLLAQFMWLPMALKSPLIQLRLLTQKLAFAFANTLRISCAHKVTHTKRLSKVTLTVLFEPWIRFSCSHSMVTMALSCIVSEIKRDIGRGLPYAEENIMIMLSRFVTILKRDRRTDRRTNRIAISTRDKNNSIHSRFPCYR